MPLLDTISSNKYQADLKFIKQPVKFEKLQNAEVSEPPLLGEHTN